MIELKEVTITTDKLVTLGNSLLAIAHMNKGDRPADITFTFNDQQWIEKDFAELQFSTETRQMMPSVESVQWDHLLIITGLRRCLLFKISPAHTINNIELFRSENDDTGFYKIEFKQCGQFLLCVYEGGVFAVSADGKMAWHKQKPWDDELISTDSDRITFLMEGGETYALDLSTGKQFSAEQKT
ncbi:hypothetical protein [Lysobacter sp. 22409]|uniref:hypothetical protein n=1 Tax=Lysobacter sp. 22409 TaxID=3453917 RepID=UPI003F864934